jgi:hypothetical protein
MAHKINTGRLSFDKQSRTFSAFISDLSDLTFKQIYADACDLGLTLVSDHTGAEVDFVIVAEHTQEGDVTHWTLEPTKQSLRVCAAARGLKLTLFND